MSRCSWGRAFRNDFVEPPRISDQDLERVNACQLQASEGLKTWKDVYYEGKFVGMVRMRIGGSFDYRLDRGPETYYGGEIGNSRDPQFSIGLLRLLNHIDKNRT